MHGQIFLHNHKSPLLLRSEAFLSKNDFKTLRFCTPDTFPKLSSFGVLRFYLGSVPASLGLELSTHPYGTSIYQRRPVRRPARVQ